ncbi:prolyl oligopeptidase family serine peptidase [Candidatus Protochlamydia phocaeensis]|uniref:prolyl oligopeptidase family serine peptidase n=1 Tax=Candidatus Protochlamydia phocaeensis TaxID=1414722 RepID=UPI0008390ACC|nr:prolyl oligopeptidase family serine peptidase [Candidatus Protochlamydia phocaeensis]
MKKTVVAVLLACVMGLSMAQVGTGLLWQTSFASSSQSSDPFEWLENEDAPHTLEWLKKQDELASAYFDSEAGREALYQELLALSSYEMRGLPVKRGNKVFFTKQERGQKQKSLYVQEKGQQPSLIIDPNRLSEEGTYSLTQYEVSQDGLWVAYGLSQAGSDWEEWFIYNVEMGKTLEETLKWIKFAKPVWSPGQQGLFYSRYLEPAKERGFFDKLSHNQLYYHRLGTSQAEDRLIYESPDHPDWVLRDFQITSDERYMLFRVSRGIDICNGIYALALQSDQWNFQAIDAFLPLGLAAFDFLGEVDGYFYFKTNYQAPRGKIIAFAYGETSPEKWIDIIKEDPRHSIENVCLAGQYLAVSYLQDVCACLKIFDLKGTFEREISLPGKGSLALRGSLNEAELFYGYMNFLTPLAIMSVEVASGQQSVFFKPELKWEPTDYTIKQVFYPSRDGTLIPLFLAHRKDLAPTSQTPVLLYGYGGFSISLAPFFDPLYMAWMQKGGVFALANIRGGGEYGAEWHAAGRLDRKQTCFDDFITAAEWLIKQGYTNPSKLAMIGRSNGGLLVGACLIQRPELFRAAIVGVGVLDMLKFHRFTIGGSWIYEYGSPDNPQDRAYLQAYSPYHNVKRNVAYPSTLILTGDHDDRVAPAHSFKFAAALQDAQEGREKTHPVLLRIARQVGHGAGRTVEQKCLESTDILQFLFKELKGKDGAR